MEQVIKQLFEIEAAAVRITEDTMDKKKELAEALQERIKRFDKKLDEDNSKKLAVYAKELNQQSVKKLKQLEEHTNEIKQLMDDVYNNHHKEIAKNLLDSVIKE